MNYTILFSALQDLQSGLFSYKQSAVKENRYVHSFALLAKVVDAMRARRLFAGAAMNRSSINKARLTMEKASHCMAVERLIANHYRQSRANGEAFAAVRGPETP